MGPSRAGQQEVLQYLTDGREHLHAPLPSRRVGDNERAISRGAKRGRSEDAARFGANLDDRVGGGHRFIDAEHRVRTAIEDEEVAGRRLAEPAGFTEPSGEVGRDRVYRDEDLGRDRRDRGGERQDDDSAERRDVPDVPAG